MKTIREEIINVKAGQYARVMYKTDYTSKLNAKSKKLGYRVEKITETTVRTGISYNNIANVIKKKEMGNDSQRNYTDPYVWVVKNRLKRKIDTGTEYCVFGTTPNANAKHKYIIYNGVSDVRVVDNISETDKKLFMSSAFTNNTIPDVITVKLENVKRFNKAIA